MAAHPEDEYDLPVYEKVMEQYGKFAEDIKAGRIISAYVPDATASSPLSARWPLETAWA